MSKLRVYVCLPTEALGELTEAVGGKWAFDSSTDPFEAIAGIRGKRPKGEELLVVITNTAHLVKGKKEFFGPAMVEAARLSKVGIVFVSDSLDSNELAHIRAHTGRMDLIFFGLDDLEALVVSVTDVLAKHGAAS